MDAYCSSCKFHFESRPAKDGGAPKCPVCGRPAAAEDDSAPRSKNKTPKLQPGESLCVCCGKVLKKGVRYCAACGTNNHDVETQAAGIMKELGRSPHRRAFEEDTGVWALIKSWFGKK